MAQTALILHGYGQDAKIAREKWDKTLKKIGIQPIYLEAPIDVVNNKNEPSKGWFLWTNSSDLNSSNTDNPGLNSSDPPDPTDPGPKSTDPTDPALNSPIDNLVPAAGPGVIYTARKYFKLEDSLSYVHQYIIDNGPFNIIIGYSQGGSLASILVDRYKLSLTHLIIISSYGPLDPEWKIQNVPNCKVLLVYGSRDTIVPEQYTLNIYQSIDVSPTVYRHDGTHSMPAKQEFINAIKTFLLS